ncbi:MAG: hypothetical protein U5Q44_02370 [Dehalococcoidia bacterium]|nr:hypothetical protein [Dehalococcoidia bacterium]
MTEASGANAFDGPVWLVSLIDWLESRRVERIRRGSYWSWHYRGRQVLRVEAQPAGLRPGRRRARAAPIPRDDQPAPLRLEVAAATSEPE